MGRNANTRHSASLLNRNHSVVKCKKNLDHRGTPGAAHREHRGKAGEKVNCYWVNELEQTGSNVPIADRRSTKVELTVLAVRRQIGYTSYYITSHCFSLARDSRNILLVMTNEVFFTLHPS